MDRFSELLNWFKKKEKVLIAVSGGVDSGLLAFAGFSALKKNALAITADYQTLSQDELNSAKKICSEIGIPHKIIKYDELTNPNFVKNDKFRCYHCRTHLSQYLIEESKKLKIQTIVDGTHLDDLGEFRPGISALEENGIQSPLLKFGFRKELIRNLARTFGLSTFNRPSNSCLASRIPWGQQITLERLTRIELAERIVKQDMGFHQVRVRDFSGSAKVEVGQEDWGLLLNKNGVNKICSKLINLGFRSAEFDYSGYQPGKLNVV